MSRARSCACNWEQVGESLGSVWMRTPGGRDPVFVAVRPDGSVLGKGFRTRSDAVLGLVRDARRREGLGEVLDLQDYRAPTEGFGRGLLALLSRVAMVGN